ncbi:MAG: hypothetical protein P9L94_16125 [Candidatus Hinthialibacter antarcticus]|nr:hypothetical protein [Candidatus Hinthialibacter antarcticus]
MDTKSIKCPFCDVEKEQGFVVDMSMGDTFANSWHPGKPEPGWLYTIKVSSDKTIPIKAMRCPQCGHLDLFAEKIRYNKNED